MNKLPFFLAQRILLANAYQKGISTMTIICFAGIFIGSFSLAVVTAIMHGFEVAIEEKMQGIHAHLTIDGQGQAINLKALSPVLINEFTEIISFSPHATRHALIRLPDESDTTPFVVILNAINPKTELTTSTLFDKIIIPGNKKQFPLLLNDNKIIIGKQLAIRNDITIGDTIELLFIREEKINNRKVTFDAQPVTVGGIFNTGIDEFDAGVIYCSFDLLEKMFPNTTIQQVTLKLQPQTNEQQLIDKLRKRIGLSVYSWKELYPSLIAAQKLEKYVSFFIIALILLVASMNIISLLYMQITQKRHDIALLKAIGMSDTTISHIFLIIGMTISISASSLGLLGSLIASYLIKRFPFITLPDTYYVTHVPIAMNWHILCAVFCVVLIFSLCATFFAIQQIRSINISRVLRFEG